MENFDKSPSLFAIMTPVDNAARDAFSQVAQKMREDKGWNPHARQNIDANEKPVQVSTYGDESESDNGTEPPKKYRPVLKGCYTFDLKIPPKSPALGWTIGGGRFGKDNESPEILLTEKKLKAGVSARHARLAHNFTSGALVISALDSKNIRVNGHKLVDGQCMIYSRTTSLTFGSLMYSLEVRRYPTDDRYRDDLRIYKETHGIPEDEYPSNIRATTAETDIVTERYVLRNPIGRGATSIVYAAHKRGNGDAVVVKKIMRTAMNAKFIARDIDISKFIGEHRRICHLVDVMDPTAEDPGHGYHTFEVDEVFLVYMPLAEWTVQHFIDQSFALNIRTREKIFWQLLEGIEFLHSIDVMHRDIKPLNMVVISKSADRPEARLIDFGLAQYGLESDSYSAGTCSYLAPEMWAGAEGRTRDMYTEKVDIFAFGLSIYQFLCHKPCDWARVDTDAEGNVSKSFLAEIAIRLCESHNLPPMIQVILSLIEWDPRTRSSAKDALDLQKGIEYQREKRDMVERCENIADLHLDDNKEEAENGTHHRFENNNKRAEGGRGRHTT